MNVFVLYSPGTGGSHLANLISTDPNLNSRWSKDDYNKMDDNAHTSNANLSKPIETWYNKNNKHVFCSHLGEFLWWRERYGPQILGRKSYQIVSLYNNIDFPKRHRFPRLLEWYQWEYIYAEQCELYKRQNLRQILSDKNLYHVPLSDLCDHDIEVFLKTHLKQFNCDVELCKFAHKQWMEKLDIIGS